MASFLLLLGTSSFFGAIGHTVHYQLSKTFFDLILLVMNATSLFAVYFLFRASYSYDNQDKVVSPFFNNVILVWISVMLYVSWLQADFALIKIHAAAILIYALFAHYRVYIKTKEKGNEMLIFGILVSFLPILVHSMHISFGVWFNHKDLAHLFMIISLCIIYSGTLINVRAIEAKVMA